MTRFISLLICASVVLASTLIVIPKDAAAAPYCCQDISKFQIQTGKYRTYLSSSECHGWFIESVPLQQCKATEKAELPEIIEIIATPLYVAYGVALYFGATANGRTDTKPIASSGGGTWIREAEAIRIQNGQAIIETPERRAEVEELISELSAKGYEPIEHGRYWYSFRFQRPGYP